MLTRCLSRGNLGEASSSTLPLIDSVRLACYLAAHSYFEFLVPTLAVRITEKATDLKATGLLGDG